MNTTIHKMNTAIQEVKIDKLKLQILDLISKTPTKPFTVDKIKELTKEAGINSNYATIYRKVESLIKMGALSNTKYGMANQIKIDLQNENTLTLLALNETYKLEEFLNKLNNSTASSIKEIINDSSKMIELKCVVIFGSYAKNKYTPHSDLDILIIDEAPYMVKNTFPQEKLEEYVEGSRKFIKSMLNTSMLRGGPQISEFIINKEDHKSMIRNKEENIAKESLNDHIILKGFIEYWKEIGEAIE